MSDPRRHTRLATVIAELGRYFGIRSKSSFINVLISKVDDPDDTTQQMAEKVQALADKPPKHKMGEFFLAATEGSHSTQHLIKEIVDMGPVPDALGFMEIIFEPAALSDAKEWAAKPVAPSNEPLGWSCAYDFADVGEESSDSFAPNGTADPDSHGSSDMLLEDVIPSLASTLHCEPVYTAHVASLSSPDSESQYPEYIDIQKVNESTEPNLSENNAVTSCFLINDPDLSPATKDSGAVSLFLSYLPTIEMSRCQVYLDVQIITHRAPVESGKISTMSLSQFLSGRKSVDGMGEGEKITTHAVNASLLGNPEFYRDDTAGATAAEPPNISSAGMELFTSPQTLVNADELWTTPDLSMVAGDPGNATTVDRSAQVMDRFRPLATLTSFSVSETPSGGMMSHKTAEISLTLHDRSRLAEISDLIRPDMYGNTELLIEYGWSHPDAQNLAGESSANPFASFIDACRVKEKFKIKNSSFSFNDAGEAEITVELFTSSAMAFNANDISKGPGVGDKLKRFQELSGLVRHLRRQISPPNEGGSSDVSGETWLGSITSPGGIGNMDRDTKRAMRTWRRNARSAVSGGTAGPATTELAAALDSLLGTGNGTGVAGELEFAINAALALKETMIASPNSGDPWWVPIIGDGCAVAGRLVHHCKIRQHIADPRFSTSKEWNRTKRNDAITAMGGATKARAFKRKFSKKYVSLGKLLSTYVIAPLAADNKFDEVQVFYYTFNEHASYMGNRNISSFPIDYALFKAELEKATTATAYVPIRKFLGILQSKFLGKSYNPAYGMADFYAPDDDKNQTIKDAYKNNPSALDDEKQLRLRMAYTGNVEERGEVRQKFKKPRIAMATEVVPGMNDSADIPASQQTILKIHIYDKAASPHNTLQDLLKGSRRGSMGTLNSLARTVVRTPRANATNAARSEVQNRLHTAMQESSIIEEIAGADPPAFKIVGGFPAIKNFIRGSMPSVVYGSQYSGVISASVSSMNDPQLASIQMMRSGGADARSPSQQAAAGLPLRVSPVEVSLNIFGCPMVNFGQQFFIDFGTGTTVDNVYAIVGISHSLTQGEFTTELKMVQLDAYGTYESTLDLITQAQPVATAAAEAE
jgi:hypothetical protein